MNLTFPCPYSMDLNFKTYVFVYSNDHTILPQCPKILPLPSTQILLLLYTLRTRTRSMAFHSTSNNNINLLFVVHNFYALSFKIC